MESSAHHPVNVALAVAPRHVAYVVHAVVAVALHLVVGVFFPTLIV